MRRPIKNMSEKDVQDLLEEAADLVVALRSWGFHFSGPLIPRDADTGKPTGKPALAKLEKIILKFRKKQGCV